MISRAAGLVRRVQWPLWLLLASVALTGAAAVDAYRTVRSQQAVADGTLRDYAHFAAWSYQQRLQGAVGVTAREALGPVYHGRNFHTFPRIPDVGDLPTYLPWDPGCACHRRSAGPTPVAFYGFVLNADTIAALINPYRDPDHGWSIDSIPRRPARTITNADQTWIHDTLTADVRSGYRSEWGFTLLVVHRPTGVHTLAYTLMPTSWGDTVVYAAEYSPRGLAAIMGAAFAADGLLPATLSRGRPNAALLWAEVRSADGTRLFTSDSAAVWQLDAGGVTPRSDGSLQPRVAIRPQLASTLVIGGLPRSRLPFLIALLGLAAALSVVAVGQLRREGELARLRADFVANVSHELRTPLAQIQLELDTIQLGRAEPRDVRTATIGRIARETRRLTYLADNILRFSRRHRTGAIGLSAATDIAALTDEIIGEFRPLAAARQVDLQTAVARVPLVALDASAYRALLLNLLDNAIKYGPSRQTVDVTVARHGEAVRITVADQGPGVPARERTAIWRPFMRGVAADTSGVGGAGIGLTIVRDVLVRYGGSASVTSPADGRSGAVFVVDFPIAAHQPPIAGHTDAPHPPGPDPSDRRATGQGTLTHA